MVPRTLFVCVAAQLLSAPGPTVAGDTDNCAIAEYDASLSSIKTHIRASLAEHESLIRTVELDWTLDQIFFPHQGREKPGLFDTGENRLVLRENAWAVSQGMMVWSEPPEWDVGRHISVRIRSVFDGSKFIRLTDRFDSFEPRYLVSRSDQIDKVVLFRHVTHVFNWCRPTEMPRYRMLLSDKSFVGKSITREGVTFLPITLHHAKTRYEFLLATDHRYLIHELEVHNWSGLRTTLRYEYRDLDGVTVPISWTRRSYEEGRVRRQTRAKVTRVVVNEAASDVIQLQVPAGAKTVPVN